MTDENNKREAAADAKAEESKLPAVAEAATDTPSQNGEAHKPYWLNRVNGQIEEKEAVSSVPDPRTGEKTKYPGGFFRS